MYFISEVDPNYRIKGSIDPLGFQSIWSAVGHKAIKHLSTVSVNLRILWSSVWTKIKIDDFQDSQSVVNELVSLICITDELEEQITGEDLVIDF